MMALGKRAPRHDARTLLLARYMPEQIVTPPACDWTQFVRVAWPLYQNDVIGDCAIAAVAFMILSMNAAAQRMGGVAIAESEVLNTYRTVSGWDPEHPGTDLGCVELDVLKLWRNTGILGHKISAFAAVSPYQFEHVKAAIALFGGAYVGLALPLTAQAPGSWEVPTGGAVGQATPGSWGPHSVAILAYDVAGLTCVTWGALRRMSWTFFATYCDEAWAVLSSDFMTNDTAPNGFDVATLTNDLTLIASAPVSQ